MSVAELGLGTLKGRTISSASSGCLIVQSSFLRRKDRIVSTAQRITALVSHVERLLLSSSCACRSLIRHLDVDIDVDIADVRRWIVRVVDGQRPVGPVYGHGTLKVLQQRPLTKNTSMTRLVLFSAFGVASSILCMWFAQFGTCLASRWTVHVTSTDTTVNTWV